MTSKKEYIKQKMKEIAGQPKYANSEIQQKVLAEKMWDEQESNKSDVNKQVLKTKSKK